MLLNSIKIMKTKLHLSTKRQILRTTIAVLAITTFSLSGIEELFSQATLNSSIANNLLQNFEKENKDPENINSQNRWSTEVLIYEGNVGAIDVAVDDLGHIYTAHIKHETTPNLRSNLIIHRSTDEGESWNELADVNISTSALVTQMQLISLHGSGDNYLLAYYATPSELRALRWNTTSGGSFTSHQVTTAVTEFALDRNYPLSTSDVRVFGVYKKNNGEVRSARSTAGSFGFDWVDESASLGNLNSLAFAYSSIGNTFVAGIDDVTGNLRVSYNTNSNDPASWSVWEDLELGSTMETANPTIAAARLPLSSGNAIVFTSARPAGSSGNFNGRSYIKNGNSAFSSGVEFDSGSSNLSLMHPDSFIRYEADETTVRLSYALQTIDASSNNSNAVLTYTGTNFEPTEPVSSPSINVFSGFISAVAELPSTNEAILVFAGTSSDGLSGQNLYFDKQSAGLQTLDLNFPVVSIYPNPATNLVHIQSTKGIDKMRVFDVSGRETSLPGKINPISSTNGFTSNGMFTNSIDVSSLKAGVYFFEVTVNGTAGTYKVIKR